VRWVRVGAGLGDPESRAQSRAGIPGGAPEGAPARPPRGTRSPNARPRSVRRRAVAAPGFFASQVFVVARCPATAEEPVRLRRDAPCPCRLDGPGRRALNPVTRVRTSPGTPFCVDLCEVGATPRAFDPRTDLDRASGDRIEHRPRKRGLKPLSARHVDQDEPL
jgi:hypothetical protein